MTEEQETPNDPEENEGNETTEETRDTDRGDHGTKEDADRSEQVPGAGDPVGTEKHTAP